MEDLGKYLKEYREEKGIEYITVYSDIRLREEQVKMMEENRFFELGPYGVVKATVFNYARYLGADLDAVMNELKILVPETTKNHHKPSPPAKQKKIMLSTNFLWSIGIIIFVLILAGILLHAYKQGWLKTPEILKSSQADTLKVEPATAPEPVKVMPDSTRLRMLELNQEISKRSQDKNKTKSNPSTKTNHQDDTDYIGNFMGDSPMNVEGQ